MKNEQSYYDRMKNTMSDKLMALHGHVHAGMNILDFGAGPSADVYEYVTRLNAEYIALDHSRQVQMLLEEKGISCIDVSYLKNCSDHFDIIFMSSVFHELLSYLSRNEAAETIHVLLSHLKEGGKLILRDWCSPENTQCADLTICTERKDEIELWLRELRRHAIFTDDVTLVGNVLHACVDDMYNILLHVTWGIQSLARESNESYLVDSASLKRFILNLCGNMRIVERRAYYQSDYSGYLARYFADADHFIEQFNIFTKQVVVFQKARAYSL